MTQKKMEQIKCYCDHTTYCDCGPLEEKPESQSNTIYVVTAYRWGDIEQHGYVIGVYSSHENAINASKIEYINLGGKYECQITEHELNFIETYYDKTD